MTSSFTPLNLSDPDQFPLHRASSGSRIRGNENVNFGSNAEVFEIDSGLDREERSRHDKALIVCFEIVHVRARPVYLGSDRVSCAVDKAIREAPAANVISRRVVNFESPNVTLRFDSAGDRFDGPISGIPNCFEHFQHAIGWGAAEARPGDVVEDGLGLIELCPHVDENEISGMNGSIGFRSWLVMRIASMGVHGDNRTAVGDHARHPELVEYPVADHQFIHTIQQLFADEPKSLGAHLIDPPAGFQMSDKLPVVETGLELLDEFGGAH